ncbi:glucose PTS transporter subunit IIA [Companilactobacillus sp.]|jgi:PTS system beta-glucosides-specific IIC component|uniref:glucose PTS transporter subunit IIA n=1 Tax=Companilactobacillus sp. TaxID=2767905 RepID=UPI0025BC6403|nr:PTS glucose transporter subunit IIABC [Companilactobacillus sp.]MCH4008594.1 glucose PTS transporter subunit IIA [Companilactobacillus sp.]MCH4051227.1 glucose PTS transporter subunit IIA [Companilactobacillus sp.]MCH4076537.1 glucose PTS transporter subunit IIA [Companilactobacillus sp.]MCH4125112.1 glucose PTS transporter subunit IIA [Companilactobacillus sp.]MCH4131652.1 glucose PTS transporter subunit IIA [Companilactobacillus sp.]
MKNEETLLSPATGQVIDITEVNDPMFSEKAMGDGFGVRPTDTEIEAPLSGKIMLVAPTKHAIGIAADDGLEVLIHMGVDTVELDGKPFEVFVSEGDVITAGEKIATMDIYAIKKAGKSTDIIVAITNTAKMVKEVMPNIGNLKVGEAAATVSLLAEGEEAAPVKSKGGKVDFDQLAKDIVKNIGGAENVDSVIHCITRVRFYLKDDKKANDDVIKNLNGVLDVARAGGQYQVVIGPKVEEAFDAVVNVLGPGFGGEGAKPAEEKRHAPKGVWPKTKFYFSSLIGVITASMMPIIGLLAASGILKGLLSLCVSFHWISATSNTYMIINAMGDAVFYFLPLLVGFTAAKRLGANQIIVAVIGGVLAYPTLVQLATKTASSQMTINADFFGIPIHVANYTYSIFPMIAAAWLASIVEPWLKKHINASIRMIVAPLVEVFVVSALILVIVGPVITFLSSLLAGGIVSLLKFSPALSGLIIGGFYQCLVIFGLHWAVIPVVASQIATTGHSALNAIVSATMVAQGAAVLAVFLKTKKNIAIKQIAGAATLSAFAGITEPAMYGINLKYGRIFWTANIGGAVGGFLTGLLHVDMWGFAGSLIGFASFINPKGIDASFTGYLIASAAALIVGFTCTYFFGFKESDLDEKVHTVEKVRLGSREPAVNK